MTDFNPQVAKALSRAIAALRETDPDIMATLDKVKNGDMPEDVAMATLLGIVMSNPETAKRFQAIMLQATEPLRVVPRNEECPTTFTPQDGHGVVGMNPLMQGALVERIQFDGDVPELRTGPIGTHVDPAVPVMTDVRNPIAIGAMLNKASTKVRGELKAEVSKRKADLEASLAKDPSTLTILRRHGDLVAHEDIGTVIDGTKDTDPDGYRRGEKPHLVTVPKPSGAILAKLTDSQRHELAWKFLSTTQGRVSAVRVIRSTIIALLRDRGLIVEEREFDYKAPRVQPLSYAEWSVTLAGPGAIQPIFSLVDVSSKVLAQRLYQGLETQTPGTLWLEVEPINRLADREVGWMARLMPKENH